MKSKLKIREFKNETYRDRKFITRITTATGAVNFILKNELHFSPLLRYKELTEGRSFQQLLIQEIDNESDSRLINYSIRKEILYECYWSIGDKSLYMWDINGKNEYAIAIQIDAANFIKILQKMDCFESNSFNNLIKNKNEFKPLSFHYSLINYCDLLNPKTLNPKTIENHFICQLKDIAFKHEKKIQFLLCQNHLYNPANGLKDLEFKFSDDVFKNIGIKLIMSPYAISDYFDYIKSSLKCNKKVKVSPSKYTKLFI